MTDRWAGLREWANGMPGDVSADVLALLDERDQLERERDDNGYGWLGCQQERDQALARVAELEKELAKWR